MRGRERECGALRVSVREGGFCSTLEVGMRGREYFGGENGERL
jgi:hypothetical protein